MDLTAEKTHAFRYWILSLLVGAALVAFVPVLWLGAAIGAIVASALVLFAAADAIHGRADWTVLSWVLLFPLGYYYVSFPSDRPLITFDRIVLGGVIVALAFRATRLQMPVPRMLKQVGIAWIIFLAGILLSLRFAPNPLGKAKELLDVFVLPGILAWYLVRSFPLRRHLSTLHVLTCLMAIYVAAIGFAEFATGADLMAAPTGVFLVEETGLNRVNGPFTTNNSYGLIGLVTLLLLIFLRRSMTKRMPTWQTLLHLVGVAAALSTAVMPLFRSILLTLVLVGGLELVKTKKTSVRFAVIIAFVVGAVGLLWFKTLAPDMFGYRVSDPSDIYARIAQQKQTLEMFAANPFNGVGWGNYIDAAYGFSDVSYKGVFSVGSAHNTLGALLAETGILGFVPFIAAQLLLLLFFWRLRRRGTHDAVLASNFCIYVFLAYWITGISLTSGYYSDINMWYVFAIAIFCKFALTEPARAQTPIYADLRKPVASEARTFSGLAYE